MDQALDFEVVNANEHQVGAQRKVHGEMAFNASPLLAGFVAQFNPMRRRS